MAEVARDLRKSHRVQDPVGGNTALPSHLDAPVHVVELGDRVGVGIDAQHTAEVECGLVPAPIQVEAPRVGVDLDHDIVLGTGAQHLLDIDFIAWPPLELAPGHVADDGGVRIGDGPKQALRLCLAVEFEAAVDARDHEVEAMQHVLRIVQRAVDQNVGLDAFEYPEILAEALVQPVGVPVLLPDLFLRETPRVVRGLGVIGDAEILETTLARGLGHRLQGLGAVGGIGVAVKDTAQILVGDELRQLALQGQLDLAAALTEFRIDEGQTEGTIDLGLVAGDQGAALVQAVGLQPHSLLNGQRLELLNVSGGAGGEEKSGAEVFAIGQADLHSIRPGSLRRFGDLGRFCNDREVADQFAAAAEVARDRHALEFGPGLAERIFGVGEQDGGTVQMEAAFSAFRDGQALQDLGLQRGTEAFGLLDTVVLGGGPNSASEVIP